MKIFKCFYGLEKAFDSIEHNILLYHLYKAGIERKAWRVISAFYDQVEACVRVKSTHPAQFLNEPCGVKQGSVISLLLFLLVFASLLVELESFRTGACINGMSDLWGMQTILEANIALLE